MKISYHRPTWQGMTTKSDRLRALKARFDAAHVGGMASLKAGDLKGFSEAIERERAVIEEQAIALANRGDELPEE